MLKDRSKLFGKTENFIIKKFLSSLFKVIRRKKFSQRPEYHIFSTLK